MSTCQDIEDFDSAYNDLIKAIGKSDESTIRTQSSLWVEARRRLAIRLQEAHKDGNIRLVNAIDAFVSTSFDSLNGDSQTLLSLYPKYLEARGAS